MDYRQMGERIYIRIDKGEEILAQVEDVCRKLHISAATFQGIISRTGRNSCLMCGMVCWR